MQRPDGYTITFAYDALGRRIRKRFRGRVTHWVWDGDKPLHEWSELEVGPGSGGIDNLTTWLFEEDSFAPLAKLTAQGAQSVVSDHLGTPLELYDGQGRKTWQAQLDSYGAVREGLGKAQDCPFRYQGQYEDVETGLYYNRFRYYDPEAGQYISQDPIGLEGGFELYSYVRDTNTLIDTLGLSCLKPKKVIFSDEGIDHVKRRHIGNHPDWEHKSKWTVKNGEWRTKTRDTFRNLDRITQDGDRFIFEKEYKKAIGIDRDGNPLYKIRVVTEKTGELVTSFPQLIWK